MNGKGAGHLADQIVPAPRLHRLEGKTESVGAGTSQEIDQVQLVHPGNRRHGGFQEDLILRQAGDSFCDIHVFDLAYAVSEIDFGVGVPLVDPVKLGLPDPKLGLIVCDLA